LSKIYHGIGDGDGGNGNGNETTPTPTIPPTTPCEPGITTPVIPDENKHYLTFGGFDSSGSSTDKVYLVDLDTQTTCVHSTLPLEMKETHAFEYNDTILVCSSFTKDDKENLQCFIWNGTVWETFATPESNSVYGFVEGVRMPGVGIWFSTIYQIMVINLYSWMKQPEHGQLD